MMCAKSFHVLVAAVKVKVKKALLSYVAKCCDVYRVLLYFEFFIP
jgi:hypothetical protein